MEHTTPSDVPQLFRLNIEVGDLAAAISFYTRLGYWVSKDVNGPERAVTSTVGL